MADERSEKRDASDQRQERLSFMRLASVALAGAACIAVLAAGTLVGGDAPASDPLDQVVEGPDGVVVADLGPSGETGEEGEDGRTANGEEGARASRKPATLLDLFRQNPFDEYPQPAEVNDVEVLAAMIKAREAAGDNPMLLMGSSELHPEVERSSYPSTFFGERNFGMDTFHVGRAGFQSLWQTMELGALDDADAVPQRKVALIAGMQWFMGEGCSPEAFLNSFSGDTYRRFMENPRISDKTKEQVRSSVLGYGVEESVLNTYVPRSLADSIDAVVTLGKRPFATEDYEAALADNSPVPAGRFGEPEEPDWDAALAQARAEGEEACTTNGYGVYDSYYEEYVEPWLAEQGEKPETFRDWSQRELADFKLFLDVCNETGIEPLVIIMPVKAFYYDATAYDRESRQLYYDMIRSTCDEYGARYADFSGYEDDTYFMRDVMHFGWEGWVYVNRALYEFFMEGGSR